VSQRAFIPIVTTALGALAALVLSACGGGDDEQPVIKRAVVQAITTKNAATRCEKLSTTSFVARVYGDLAQCKKAEQPDAGDKRGTGAKVSDVKVDGDAATAGVRISGGDNDGAAGTLNLRKQDGDWRIDDLGVDLLRSEVRAGFANADEPPLNDPKLQACATKALAKLPDGELRRVAYLAISETTAGKAEFSKLLVPCLSISGGAGGTSFVRSKFEAGIASKARTEGMSESSIGCINGELRSSISDAEIGRLATNGAKPTPAMNRAIVKAFGRCQGRRGSQGATVLRELFERGVRKGAAKRNVPKQTLSCVLHRLRSAISDDDIIAAATNPRRKAQITRKTAAELVRCGAVTR